MTEASSTKPSEGRVSRRSCVAAIVIAFFLAPDLRGQTEGPFESEASPPQSVIFHNVDPDPTVEVIWDAPEVGRNYVIESSTDLQSWNPYLGEVTTADGDMSLTVSVAEGPHRFFRLRYAQSPANTVRDTFDENGNGSLEFPEVLEAASMAGPPVLPFLVELQLQGQAEGALELEQAFHSIPDPFLMDVFNLGLDNLDLNQLWDRLDPNAQQAISSAATGFTQSHGLMLQLIVMRVGELAYSNLPESPQAHQGLQDLLSGHFGREPRADRAAIRALVRSTQPPAVSQVQDLFVDLQIQMESPDQMYAVPFDVEMDWELEIERTQQDLLDALTLPWLPPFPLPCPDLNPNPFGGGPGQEIGCWPEVWKWGWMEPYRQGLI